jgi:hypothetical protein
LSLITAQSSQALLPKKSLKVHKLAIYSQIIGQK